MQVVNRIEERCGEIDQVLKQMMVEEKEADRLEVEVDNEDAAFIGGVFKEEDLLSMNFQVAGVKKALAAVSRICRAGNVVQFGELEEECFIKNKENRTYG